MPGKKSQVGETVTWFVATVAILVILTISIFAASSLAKLNHQINIYSEENLLLKNSLYGYLNTRDESGNTTFQLIEKSGKFNEFTSGLGSIVLNNLNDDISFNFRVREGSTVYYAKESQSDSFKTFEKNNIRDGLNLEVVG